MAIKLQRTKNLLTVRELRALADGVHSDGDRLRIVVEGGRAKAVFRYTSPAGKRREAGLGLLRRGNDAEAGRSLAAARAKADTFRDMLDQVDADGNSIGVDPLDARDRQRTEAKVEAESESRRRRSTLLQCARSYHERVIGGKRSTRHASEWISSIERHIPNTMLRTPVDEITAPMLFDVLAPLQTEIPETAGRVRQRLEKVIADAEFRGLAKGNAAAAIKDKLRDEGGKRERANYRALPYTEVPAFMAKLKDHTGVAHRLMEFTILTACRTNESRMMVWPEVDLEAGRWAIPGNRMKAGKEHVITLSPRALEIVRDMRKLRDELKLDTDDGDPGYVFPSLMKRGKPLSAMAMLVLTRKMGFAEKVVTHGFRSSFSDWAYSCTPYRSEVIESALAHSEAKGSKVKRAYLRTNFERDCAVLLHLWHDFILGVNTIGNVVPMQANTQPIAPARVATN